MPGSGVSFKGTLIALHPVSGLLLGAGVGYLAGEALDVAWLFPVFLLAGLAVGCLNAYRDGKAMIRQSETDNARQNAARD